MIWLLFALAALFLVARALDLRSTLAAHEAGFREGNPRADTDGDGMIDVAGYLVRTAAWGALGLALYIAGTAFAPLHAAWVALYGVKAWRAWSASRHNRKVMRLSNPATAPGLAARDTRGGARRGDTAGGGQP